MTNPILDSILHDFYFGTALHDLAERALNVTGATGSAIALRRGDVFVCGASCGETAPAIGAIVDSNSGVTGACIRDRITVVCGDTAADPRVDPIARVSLGIASLLAVPVIRNGEVVAVVEALSNQPNAFGPEQQLELQTLADELPHGSDWLPETAPFIESREQEHDPGTAHFSAADPGEDEQNLELPTLTFTGEPLETAIRRSPGKRRLLWAVLTPTLVCLLLGSVFLLYSAFEKPASYSSDAVTTSSPVEPAAPPATVNTESQGTQPDAPPEENLASLEKAARAGDAGSQLALADRLARGDGFPKDLVTACAWYTLANMAGQESSNPNLVSLAKNLSTKQVATVRIRVGQMFESGIGVKRDLVSAYTWFTLAGAAGSSQASRYEHDLASRMTAKQVSSARQRANDWLARHHATVPNADAEPTAENRSPE